MKTVEFLGKQYVVEGSVGAPENAVFLDTLPAAKLVELCNLLISNLDLGRRIKMFQNKSKGIARVASLLCKYDVYFDDDLPAEIQPDTGEGATDSRPAPETGSGLPAEKGIPEAPKADSAPTGPTISVADLLRHDFKEEDVEIVNLEWPHGIPATEASVKRAFYIGMDGAVFLKAIAEATTKPAGKVRDGSKQAALIELLERPEGASIKEISADLKWLNHTVRGAISRDLKKRLGLPVIKSRIEGRGQVYRIAE